MATNGKMCGGLRSIGSENRLTVETTRVMNLATTVGFTLHSVSATLAIRFMAFVRAGDVNSIYIPI
jgi:hypothetical protein